MVTPAEGSFLSHANYLRALASEAGLTFPSSESKALARLADRVQKSPSMADTPPGSLDYGQVRKSLANAWGTELLLALSGLYAVDDEIVRLANNWAVVQAYYVVYHATQALSAAKGFMRPDSHPKTQNQYVNFWIRRPLDLSPWTLAAGPGGWHNCPSGRSIDPDIHVWTACNTSTQLSLAGKAYRTTRDDDVQEAVDRLRERKRVERRKCWLVEEASRLEAGRKPKKEPKWPKPRLTEPERQAASRKVSPCGLIHYLYRLRIKTNYVDSSMFTEGSPDEARSTLVYRDLRYIASATMLLHELHIRHLVGKSRFTQWVDDWVSANAPAGGLQLALPVRRPHL